MNDLKSSTELRSVITETPPAITINIPPTHSSTIIKTAAPAILFNPFNAQLINKNQQLANLQASITNIENTSIKTTILFTSLVGIYAVSQAFTYLGNKQNNVEYSTIGLALMLFSSIVLGAGLIYTGHTEVKTKQKKIAKQQQLLNNLTPAPAVTHASLMRNSSDQDNQELMQTAHHKRKLIESLEKSINNTKTSTRWAITYVVGLVAIYAAGQAFSYIGDKQNNINFEAVGLCLTTFSVVILMKFTTAGNNTQLTQQKILNKQKKVFNLIHSQ